MDKKVYDAILKFRNDREWIQFHNGKDLSLSLSLEASELLEVYQWSGTDLDCKDKVDKIKEELADIFIYATLIAERYNLDINQIILDKLEKNAKKYPIDKAKGIKDKYTELK